jgi:hypothetical protein
VMSGLWSVDASEGSLRAVLGFVCLQLLVDSMRAQSGMKGVYGNHTEAQMRQMRIDVASARERRAAAALEAAAAAKSSAAHAAAVNGTDAPVATASSSLLTSKQQRRLRHSFLRPCLQWNRGGEQACTQTPCRYSHICMGCNGDHRAVTCPTSMGERALVEKLKGVALKANTPAASQTSAAATATPAGVLESK